MEYADKEEFISTISIVDRRASAGEVNWKFIANK